MLKTKHVDPLNSPFSLLRTNGIFHKATYSRTSMAQTLMAHSPGLSRTVIMVPTGHFMPNPPWMAGTTLG